MNSTDAGLPPGVVAGDVPVNDPPLCAPPRPVPLTMFAAPGEA
jgi:hypothetical protein